MKNYWIALALIFSSITVWSQSFIGVTVGYDFAKIKQTESTQPFVNDGFVIWNKGFSARSMFYGIQGEKNLSQKFSIAINLLYNKKEVDATNGYLVPIEGIKFNSYSGIVAGKWYPLQFLYISTGLSFSYLSKVRSYIHTGTEYPIELANKKKYGHLLSIGLQYKGVLIGPYFINGLNIGKKTKDVDLKPIDSYGFSLSYLLRVSKEKNKPNKRKK